MKHTSPRFASPLPAWLAGNPVITIASRIYAGVIRQRNKRYDRHPHRAVRMRLPVISIGGIRAGGTGKTPAVMLLTELLQKEGYTVGLLTRGYKRSSRRPLLVAPDEPVSWDRIGDEPAMVRAACPGIWLGIGPDRTANAVLLQERMGDKAVLLLDDGFQHRRLHRDIDIVCLHEEFDCERLLPQGYLREPVASLTRAHCYFLIGTSGGKELLHSAGERLATRFSAARYYLLFNETVSFVNARTLAESATPPFATPTALCGIARPERFFTLLDKTGVRPGTTLVFPDHHHYRECDITHLRKLYSQGLITTEKDAVRLASLDEIPEESLWYLKVRLRFSENSSFNRFNHYINAVLDKNQSVV